MSASYPVEPSSAPQRKLNLHLLLRSMGMLAALMLIVSACSGGISVTVSIGSTPVKTVAVTVPTATPVGTANPTSVAGGDLSWLKVYFTNPNPPDQQGTGIDRIVVPVLNAARKTIDVTSFDFTLPSVANALVSAKQRGVTVRVVLDLQQGVSQLKGSDSAGVQPFDALGTLQGAGITVVDGGHSSGLMHNKMIIIDGATLFMGSWNMSYNDTFRNNNNLLQITNPTLIANYQAKFNELFVAQKFGPKAIVGAQTPKLTIDGTDVENYFSPVDKVMSKLVAEVGKAQKSVKFIIFTYTHAALSGIMIDRFNAGVKVEGVIENRGASQGAMPALYCAKIPVLVDGNSYTMHHKVIIIDDQVVITGSYNFTQTADSGNDDNILIIRSSLIAALYNQEFARIYGGGKAPDPAKIDCLKSGHQR